MMIKDHKASASAYAKAKKAGYDLDELKAQGNEELYKVFNAEKLFSFPANLKDVLAPMIFEGFPEHDVFVSESAPYSFMIFPALDKEAYKQLDEVLSHFVSQEALSKHYLYYRVVSDLRGTHREMAWPLAAKDWQGQGGVMVGPFAKEELAQNWAQAHIAQHNALAYDIIFYMQQYFCDVFSNDEALL